MDRREVAMIGFEIVAYAGEARSKYLQALKLVKQDGAQEEIERLIEEGNASLGKAHRSQTELIAKEAGGEEIELGLIFVHGQDHLMTAILLQDILENLIDIYK